MEADRITRPRVVSIISALGSVLPISSGHVLAAAGDHMRSPADVDPDRGHRPASFGEPRRVSARPVDVT